jgi:hypothetical protein
MLPGFFGGARKVEFFDSATSKSATIQVPPGVRAGDIIVLADYAIEDGDEPDLVIPSGFTSWMDYGGDTSASGWESRLLASYKIAAGTEGGTNLTGMAGDEESKALVVFRPNFAVGAVTRTDSGGSNTNSNPAPVSILSGAGAPPLIVFGFYAVASGSISPRTMTPAKDSEINAAGDPVLYMAWKIYNSSPANVQIDMDDEGNLNTLAGGFLEVA